MLLGAPGRTTRSKDATSNNVRYDWGSWHLSERSDRTLRTGLPALLGTERSVGSARNKIPKNVLPSRQPTGSPELFSSGGEVYHFGVGAWLSEHLSLERDESKEIPQEVGSNTSGLTSRS